jgi:hypothetical protein
MPGMWLFPRGLAIACGHGIAVIARLQKQSQILTARRDIVNRIGIIEIMNKKGLYDPIIFSI